MLKLIIVVFALFALSPCVLGASIVGEEPSDVDLPVIKRQVPDLGSLANIVSGLVSMVDVIISQVAGLMSGKILSVTDLATKIVNVLSSLLTTLGFGDITLSVGSCTSTPPDLISVSGTNALVGLLTNSLPGALQSLLGSTLGPLLGPVLGALGTLGSIGGSLVGNLAILPLVNTVLCQLQGVSLQNIGSVIGVVGGLLSTLSMLSIALQGVLQALPGVG